MLFQSANPANIDGGGDALPSLMSVRHNSIGVGGGAPTHGFFDSHSQARPTSGVSAPYGKFFHHPGGDDFASTRSFNNLPQRGHYFANYARGGNGRVASRDEGPTDLIAMMLKEERQEEEVQGLSFFSKRQPIIPSRFARGTDGMPMYSSSYWKTGERRQPFEFGGGLQQQQQPIPRMMRLNSEGEFNIVDFRNKSRLKKLLRIPEDKDLWLETKTGQTVDFNSDDWHTVALDGRTYFYNPVTFRIFFERLPASRCVVVQQTELQKLLDAARNVEKLLNDKIQMLADRNELARVRSLLNIGDEVKLTNPANIDGGGDALPSLMSVRHNSIGVGGGAPTHGFFDSHPQARPTSGVSAPYGKFFHHPGGDDFASTRNFNNLPQRGHYFANYARGGNGRVASRDEGPTDLIAMMLKEERQEEEVQGLSFFRKRQPINPSRFARGTDGMPMYSSSYWKTGERRQPFEFGGGLQQQQQPIPRMMRLNSEGEFNIVDFRNKSRLKKLLRIPEDKDLWLETKTGQTVDFNSDDWHTVALDGRTYFYNPVTFRIFFERLPASRCVVVQQTELQKLLDATTPSTLIVKRISSQLTEQSMSTFFEQYGKVAFSTICRYEDMVKSGDCKPSDHCYLAFIRMESIAAQSKILAKRFHLIDGLEAGRDLPIFNEKVSVQDLMAYFSEEIWKIDSTAYCVDAYFPVPFTQFAFVTCGGQQIAAKLAVKADLIFKHQSITVSALHFEEGGNVEKLLNDKIQMLADRNELARVRSLLNIGDEVKLTLQLLAKTRKFTNPMLLLNEINTEFLKCTEEKIRNYLSVQEHVLDICKIVALKEGAAGGENDGTRKRKRKASDGEETLNDEEEVEEGTMQNAIFDDDNIAQAVVGDRSFKSEL
uniref:RRM domain-containing protein n=1 Tax=Globodera pallida TaxID=36090 RepID=A0A183CCF3_GLOPA